MRIFKEPAVDAGSPTLEWAPRLLRFFQLFVGDQAMAEALTLQVLEESRLIGRSRTEKVPIGLLRRAALRAGQAPEPSTIARDQIIRAVTALPHSERMVIALFRGTNLSLEEVAMVVSFGGQTALHEWTSFDTPSAN